VGNSELKLARRSLEDIREVQILSDWKWQEQQKMWRLDLRLAPKLGDSDFVPSISDWCVLVSDVYPSGDIDFFPSAKNSLIATFQHQNYNGDSVQEWRAGKLCLDTPVSSLGRGYDNEEPFDAGARLRWHVDRALQWLVLASYDELAKIGDPFELPYIPFTNNTGITVAFRESEESMIRWQEHQLKAGRVSFYRLRRNPEVLVVKNFKNFKNEVLVSNQWGKFVNEHKKDVKEGLWITIPSFPILPPWQIPMNWGELREACHNQRIDLEDVIWQLYKQKLLKGGELLLFGFPIPEAVGGEFNRYHWQPLRLPILHPSHLPVPGFRPDVMRAWKYNSGKYFKDNSPLVWLRSENWAYDQITSRGKMDNEIASKRISLIGAGAIGSVVGELLVRGGCNYLTIIDGDLLRSGNLVRHNLTLENVGQSKAESLTTYLNKLSPFAEANFINASFPDFDERTITALENSEIIIACTGDEEVISDLGRYDWNTDKWFCSISLGGLAKRLFVFVSEGKLFATGAFQESIKPWLTLEKSESIDFNDFPREGIGCWHPVFPARADDIWLLAATGVKVLERAFSKRISAPEMLVFKQSEENGFFAGIKQDYLYKQV
jgi:molybdopterin/thiamine biosynthesis adenylyltransferase